MAQPFKQAPLTSISYLLVGFLSLFIAFPFFILLHKQLPEYDWPFHSDRILIFLCVAIFMLLLLSLFRPIINFLFAGTLLLLLYGSLVDSYGFKHLVTDYKAMFYNIKFSPEEDNMQSANERFIYKNEILGATDFYSPAVRSFALSAISTNFKTEQNTMSRYRDLIQCFAVFKKINRKWNYVNDPKGQEYFAKASESVKFLAGDCDDHAITMVAAIRSIGGTARFVSTTGHLYPEMLIGDKNDLEQMNYLIKNYLFPVESVGQSLHYHTDASGKIWLNLDYTAAYPGGRFFAEPVKGILVP
jgi:Transglutaminase-like superfamily